MNGWPETPPRSRLFHQQRYVSGGPLEQPSPSLGQCLFVRNQHLQFTLFRFCRSTAWAQLLRKPGEMRVGDEARADVLSGRRLELGCWGHWKANGRRGGTAVQF